MKKKIQMIALVASMALVQCPLYAISDTVISKSNLFQEGKMKIKKEELPLAAKNTLEGDAYKGWSVVSIYKTKDGQYEVELKKGDTTQALRFDKEGKVIG